MEFPKGLKYTENDEWIGVDGDVGTVGITDFAQDELSDVVYVEVTADIGDTLEKGAPFGTVESVKAASDLYMPVAGQIIETNEALIDAPEQVNASPYDKAWMMRIKIADAAELDDLMDSASYEKYVQERSA